MSAGERGGRRWRIDQRGGGAESKKDRLQIEIREKRDKALERESRGREIEIRRRYIESRGRDIGSRVGGKGWRLESWGRQIEIDTK